MAYIGKNAVVSGNAEVSDSASVCGNARVSNRARVSGDARVSGNALVSDRAQVSGSAQVLGEAEVSGDSIVTTPQGLFFGYFKARSGIYGLTLTRTARGTTRFVWGCREGDDLRVYLSDESYKDLRAPPLAFLDAFELANGVE